MAVRKETLPFLFKNHLGHWSLSWAHIQVSGAKFKTCRVRLMKNWKTKTSCRYLNRWLWRRQLASLADNQWVPFEFSLDFQGLSLLIISVSSTLPFLSIFSPNAPFSPFWKHFVSLLWNSQDPSLVFVLQVSPAFSIFCRCQGFWFLSFLVLGYEERWAQVPLVCMKPEQGWGVLGLYLECNFVSQKTSENP